MADGGPRNTPHSLPAWTWEKIEAAIRTIGHGSITIIVQDGRVIQIEINEKIRVTGEAASRARPAGDARSAAIRAEIAKVLGGLRYGQVIIQIKDGKATQIDRTETKRIPWLEGMGGDGI